MKVDLYGHEQRYKNWKEESARKGYREEELTKPNSDILIKYVFDMEIGVNISNKNKKGARSYPRLNNIRQRLSQIFRMLQERGIKDATKISEKEITVFFTDMCKGAIRTSRGEMYKSAPDYIKIFKAFWHWWMKINRKEGKTISDITEDLDTRRASKPKWVYMDDEQIDSLLKKAEHYKPLLAFLFDGGTRVTEALSLRIKDISQEDKGEVWVDIPDEISKTFGRKIKLILCGKDLIKYIQENKLNDDDLLFPYSAPMVNRYLNELGKQLFGDGYSKAGERYPRLTMYDFRHCSSCYWLKRYKTIGSIMYRFGWKSEKYIHYYSEFLGMKDPIKQDDLYIDITKADMEKEIATLKKDDTFQKGRIGRLENEFKDLLNKYKNLAVTVKISDEMTSKNAKIKKEFKKTAENMMASGELNPFH